MHRPLQHLSRLLLFTGISIAALTGCKDGGPEGGATQRLAKVPELQRPTLSFYHIPDCFLCADLQSVIDAAEKRYRSQMTFRTVDYHLPKSQEAIKRFDLGSHGIVITSAEGVTLWSMRAHDEGKDALAAAITKTVNGQFQGR